MDDMARRFADRAVSSVFIYTREAHPGEKYGPHSSMDVKRTNAKAFREQYNVGRPILLDDLGGTIHRAFGMLPNMAWIIGRGGFVYYKANWTSPTDIETALEMAIKNQVLRAKEGLMPYYSERLAWRVDDPEAFHRGLVRTGQQAIDDYYRKED
jgi:hypothetical protein